MDITPQLIRETTFHESLRGYNRDEVEDYKHRWAEAVAQLQGRLIEAVERAERAEARAIAASGRSESEEAFRRTLLLAQRTADQAIEEANARAQEIVSGAERQAAGVLDEAQTRARRMLDHADGEATTIRSAAQAEAQALAEAAEVEARQVIEAARGTIVEEVTALENRRHTLTVECSTLEEELAQRREEVAVALALLDDSIGLHRTTAAQELSSFRKNVLEELDSLTRIYSVRNETLERAAAELRSGLDHEALRARVGARTALDAAARAAAPAEPPPSAEVPAESEPARPGVIQLETSERPVIDLSDLAEPETDRTGGSGATRSDSEPDDDMARSRVSPVAEALGRSSARPSALSRAMLEDDEVVERTPTDSFTERLRSAVDDVADDDDLSFFAESPDEPKKRFRRRS